MILQRAQVIGLFGRGRSLGVTGMDRRSMFDLDKFGAQNRSRYMCDPSAVNISFRSKPLSTRNSAAHSSWLRKLVTQRQHGVFAHPTTE